jgi:hypothetical protein
LGFTNWPVILLHQLATIKFSGTIITEPSVTHLTLIDARVVSRFMEIVSKSCGIVPGKRLMIY